MKTKQKCDESKEDGESVRQPGNEWEIGWLMIRK